jgi:hypothetical protein
MKKKVKNYVYSGLGFPVVLATVELREHGKDQFPMINNRKLQDAVFDFLIDHPVRLTGAQIAFIRKYMELTQGGGCQDAGLNRTRPGFTMGKGQR